VPSFGAIPAHDPYKSIKVNLRDELQRRLSSSALLTLPSHCRAATQQPDAVRSGAAPLSKPVFSIPKRNHSVGNIFRQLDRRLSEQQSECGSQENLLLRVGAEQARPSCTQSRTFKLLQETLDNGKFLVTRDIT